MDGEKVQDLIYNWLNRHYPEGPGWQDPDFDCYGDAPIEIKMISAFDAVEYNIGNGGWSQVLWNCFGCWRKLLEIAAEGYTLIGAPERADALRELYVLCERDEKECEKVIYTDTPSEDTEDFAEFTRRSYGVTGNDWQRLFWFDSGIYEKRLEWLAQNEARIRRAIGELSA